MKVPDKLSDEQCAALQPCIAVAKKAALAEIARALAATSGPPQSDQDMEHLAEQALIAAGVEMIFSSAAMRANREGRRDAFRSALRDARESLSDLDRIYLDWKSEKDSGAR